MQKFKEDDQASQDRILLAFMLDTTAEELYGQAVRSLLPSAARILLYSNSNAISNFQQSIAVDQLSSMKG